MFAQKEIGGLKADDFIVWQNKSKQKLCLYSKYWVAAIKKSL